MSGLLDPDNSIINIKFAAEILSHEKDIHDAVNLLRLHVRSQDDIDLIAIRYLNLSFHKRYRPFPGIRIGGNIEFLSFDLHIITVCVHDKWLFSISCSLKGPERRPRLPRH